jgi:hypothetical protein
VLHDDDWFMRQVMVVATAIEKALDLAAERNDESEAEAEARITDLLERHFEHTKLVPLRPQAVVRVLRPPGRVRSYAVALSAHAAILRQRGADEGTVNAIIRRALGLHLEAYLSDRAQELVDREGIEALLEQMQGGSLEERHVGALRELGFDGSLAARG